MFFINDMENAQHEKRNLDFFDKDGKPVEVKLACHKQKEHELERVASA